MSADHTDLSPTGMAAPCQAQRQPAGCSAGEAMVLSEGANAREWRVLPANHSLAGWTAPSEVREKYTGKERCALYTCGECSQRRIVCGLIADHSDLSPAGMAAPWEMQRQPAGCSAGEAMVPSQGTNARERRALPADHSLAEWTAPSEVQKKHIGKERCALYTCAECSQCRIVCGLIADHTDLPPAGMAAPSQV